MKNLKIKSILWFSVATLSCGVIVPLAYQAHTYTQKMQMRNQAKQEQVAAFKDVDVNQLDSMITEQLSSSTNNQYKTQLHSANPNNGEYEIPPEINYHEEVKNNALKIISGEYLIIDLQEKFNQEYIGNEDKYQSIINDYSNLNISESISYSQNNYLYSTSDSEALSINDIKTLYNLDNILVKMNDYYTGVKVMAGVSTASTVVAWGVVAFYWSAWWMFGGNVPFAIAATIQAGALTKLTYDSWDEFYNTEKDINLLKEINSQMDKNTKQKLLSLINSYRSVGDLSRSIIEVFGSVYYYTLFEEKILNILSNSLWKNIKWFGLSIMNKAEVFIGKTAATRALISATSWVNAISAVLNIVDIVLNAYNIALNIWKISILQI